MVRRGSAAWVIAVVALLALIVGGMIITSVDPIMQGLFDSQLWNADTADGSNALKWQERVWAFYPVAILVALLVMVFVDTRQPT